MPISPNASALNNIIASMESDLLPTGFIRRGRAFRRTTEPGYVQIFDFGMALSTSYLAGHFTVDLSIFVEEQFEAYWNTTRPKRLSTCHCELTRRLPMLAAPYLDKWWPVGDAPTAVISEVTDLLLSHGLPFMDRLRSRTELVDAWRSEGNDIGLPPRGGLSVAIILQHLGAADEATSLVNIELQDPNTAYREFVESIAARAGIHLPGV